MEREPIIVESKSAYLDTLFQPVNGRTADGYVVRRSARFIELELFGRQYVINRWGVWATGTRKANAFAFSHDLPFDSYTRRQIVEALSVDAKTRRMAGERCLCYPDGRYTETEYWYA